MTTRPRIPGSRVSPLSSCRRTRAVRRIRTRAAPSTLDRRFSPAPGAEAPPAAASMPFNSMSDRRRRARAGNSLVEFAIILPLFWALFTGMFQFGKSIWLYARIQEAVAAGARYASHVDFDEPGHTFAGRIAN